MRAKEESGESRKANALFSLSFFFPGWIVLSISNRDKRPQLSRGKGEALAGDPSINQRFILARLSFLPKDRAPYGGFEGMLAPW